MYAEKLRLIEAKKFDDISAHILMNMEKHIKLT